MPIERMQGYNMPIGIPPQMDEDMVFPGGGDLGMEMSYPYEQNLPQNPLLEPPNPGGAQAVPVHSMGEMQQFYKGMGAKPTQPVEQMTGAFEAQPPGPIREKLHSSQHKMMQGDQRAAIQSMRTQLTMKSQQLGAAIMRMERGGRMLADRSLLNALKAQKAATDSALSQIPMEYGAE